MMQLELSDRQRATISTALTIVAGFVILCAIGAILWLLGAFVSRFSNVFLPIAVAAVAALVATPYFDWLRKRMPATVAMGVLFISVLLPLAGFGWFFGYKLVDQITGLIAGAPEIWQKIVAFVTTRWPPVMEFFENNVWGIRLRQAFEGREATLVEGLQTGFDAVLSASGRVFRGIAAVLTWAVLPVYFAFFLMVDPRKFLDIDHLLPFLKSETRANVIYLVKEFVEILVAFFRGQLIIAFLQGALFALGFSIAGLRYGLVLGLMLGFLNIIPYLGNMVGLAVALPLAYFQVGGGWLQVGWVMLVFVAVQMIEGYILTPRIMGDRTGLHPMAIIIAIFFWGSALGGIAGMILAIPLTAFLVVFWRLAKEKYIGELL